ncbi:MAG: phosphotransferase [Rhodoluna sp.]|nr:phosphotransferase [Rhodoluna sp.]
MGKPSLILAALAADALPGVRFVSVQDLADYQREVKTLVLTTEDSRQVLLKSPRTVSAATIIGTEVRALRVLRQVALPFQISALLGESSVNAERKAFLFDCVGGREINLDSVKPEDPIVAAVALAIAKIHSIPTALVSDAGLPEYVPAQSVKERVAEFDRAMDTGKIHRDLLERWQAALLDINLFRFQPTVVHGNLQGQYLLTDGTDITGITDWSSLSIDDPAVDLSSLYGEASPEVAAAITLAYEGYLRADKNLRQRANLYFELSLASYLLQTTEAGTEDEISEAEGILANLLNDLHAGLLPSLTPTEFAVNAPEVVTPISAAASFTSPIAIVTENIEVIDLAKPDNSKPEEDLF